MVIDSGLLKYAFEGIDSEPSIVGVCLCIFGNVAAGNQGQTQFLLENDILNVLSKHIHTFDDKVIKDTY
jgi:hypothetical protein